MSDLISRQAAIDAHCELCGDRDKCNCDICPDVEVFQSLPPAEPNCSEIPNNSDCISRQAAITAIQKAYADTEGGTDKCAVWKNVGLTNALHIMQDLPSAQPDVPGTNVGDMISRQAAIDELDKGAWGVEWDKALAKAMIESLPSAQPQRTCVNCGRTVNNGGWYADGRTRCPIEEHYALPKDGYCHLWEKRNVTDDDYPERREE